MSRTRTIPSLAEGEVAYWQPSKINALLDRLDKLDSANIQAFIDAGRGNETASETWKLNDPLAQQYKRIAEAKSVLRAEISRRYGPNAPPRLPRGFGPIKRY